MRRLLLAAFFTLSAASAWAQGHYPSPTNQDHTVLGKSSLNGNTTVGTDTAGASLLLNGQNNNGRPLFWQTASKNRLQFGLTDTETGTGDTGSNLRLFGYHDDGTPFGEIMRFTRSNGNVSFNNNGTFGLPTYLFKGQVQNTGTFYQTGTRTLAAGTSMGSGPINPMGIFQNVTWTGTVDTGSGTPNLNMINVADTANFARALPGTADLNISHAYNAGANGDRVNLVLTYNKLAAATDGLDTAPFNLLAFMHYDVGESTNPAAPSGRASSVNFDTRAGNNAGTSGIAFRVVLVQENDLRLTATSTSLSKGNTTFHNGVADAGHGSIQDYAISFSSAGSIDPGTGGNTVLMQIGELGQDWPIDTTLTTSAIMRPMPVFGAGVTHPWQATAGYGMDLFGVNFLNFAWRSTGWTVDGQGQQTIGPASLTYISGGAKLSVPGFTEVSAAVASGGSGYKVGDQIWDPYGGLWNVATLSGTAIATVTAVAGHSGFPTAANPAGVAVKGGTGLNNATLNITTAPTGLLQLGDTGQNVIVGSGSALATNATSGFLQIPTMAGAPTGVAGALGKAAFVVDTANQLLCYSTGSGVWTCPAGSGGGSSFSSPPALGNVAPNTVAATAINMLPSPAVFSVAGVPWIRFNNQTSGLSAVIMGKYAGINLPSGEGHIAIGHWALGSETDGTSESVAIGPLSLPYAVNAHANVYIGEHTGGQDTAPIACTAVGADVMRDTTDCAGATIIGSGAAADGHMVNDTSVGNGNLHGSAGTIMLGTGTPSVGSVYTVTYSSASGLVTGSPLTVNYTVVAGDTTALLLAQHFWAAINATIGTLVYTIPAVSGNPSTYVSPSSLTTLYTDSQGVNYIALHQLGTQTTGSLIDLAVSCTGTCTNTITRLAASNPSTNTLVGRGIMGNPGITTPSNNVLIGNSVAADVSQAFSQNVIIGSSAGAAMSTDTTNVAIGFQSMLVAHGTTNNVAVGKGAGIALTTANANTLLGVNAGKDITTSGNNLCLGVNACQTLATAGGNNIVLSTTAGNGALPTSTTTNLIQIGGLLTWTNVSTAVPVLSACGTGSPTVESHSNMAHGVVTEGTTTTGCVVTFATAYRSWNHCKVGSQTPDAAFSYSYTLAAITIVNTSSSGHIFDYACFGN